MGMVHGLVNLIYDDQGGPRGATQTFSNSWLMLLARRALSDGAFGRLGTQRAHCGAGERRLSARVSSIRCRPAMSTTLCSSAA